MRLIDADALKKKLIKFWNIHDDQDFANKDIWREIENASTIDPENRTIRSQQSEQKRTFLEIDVSYPTICTYPEYEGKPYYAIKYLEDGEIIVGFGTYKPDVLSEYLRKYFIQSADTKRTAKVYHKQAPDRLYYFYCGACEEMIDYSFYEDYKSIKSYCGYCGAKLDWSEE